MKSQITVNVQSLQTNVYGKDEARLTVDGFQRLVEYYIYQGKVVISCIVATEWASKGWDSKALNRALAKAINTAISAK